LQRAIERTAPVNKCIGKKSLTGIPDMLHEINIFSNNKVVIKFGEAETYCLNVKQHRHAKHNDNGEQKIVFLYRIAQWLCI
jgi:hypothetical protein